MPNFITNDDVSINYHEYGNPEAQTVVFINGYSSSEVTWFLQVKSFVKAGFHVLSYDHRNHGKSEKTDKGRSLQRLAMDLHQLMSSLRLEKPILIGHSMGAAVIMAYEELFTDEVLLAVVTEDQTPSFLKSADWLNAEGKELKDLADFMQAFPKTPMTRKSLSEEVKRELGKGMLPFDFKANLPFLRNVMTQDWRPVLVQEQRPHLFIAGEESPIFSAKHAEAAKNLTKSPLSQSLIFEGCGHIPHLEDAEKFDQAVFEFIESVKK